MSIDFLEYLRLQFPWLVMPSTNPFSQATTGIPEDPDEVPPIIHIPGPSGGIGQDVKGKQPEPPGDQRTPQQKREDEEQQRKIERENEKARKRWAKEEEKRLREWEAYKKIHPIREPLSGQTEAEKKKSEVFKRLMEQKVIIGEPQRPGTSVGSGVVKAGASTDDTGEKEKRPSTHRWREWSPEANAILEQLQNIDDPERRQSILEDAVDPTKKDVGYLQNVPLPSNIWDYMSGGRMPSGIHAEKLSPEELQEKAEDPDQKLSEIETYQYWEMAGRPGFDDPHPLYEIDPFEVSELGQDIPLRKEFDPDDFISDFLDYKGKHYVDPATRGEKWKESARRFEGLTEGAFLSSREKKTPSLPYSPYQAPPTSEILELNELRDSQLKDRSTSSFFEQNAFDRDPKTGKPLESKEASGMTDEAELFLRRIASGIANRAGYASSQFNKEEEAADVLNQIWESYQDAAAENFEWIDENFDASYWTSMSPSAKVDMWIGGWLNNLEEKVYGQGTEIEMWDDERGEPAWGQDRERESIVRYGKPPYDTAGNISALDARWDKLSESIKDKLISVSDDELADWLRGLVSSLEDDPRAMAGEVEWGETWVDGVLNEAIKREVSSRLNDIIKRTLPPPLSGASGATEYTRAQFPFLYTQNEMDRGLKTATWRKPGTYISKHAEVGHLFQYETKDGKQKIYRITNIIEEKRWENVSKRWKEEGFTSKEALAQTHKDMHGMSKERWDQQSELFKEGKGIWHDTGKTIVFKEATDLTDEVTNLGKERFRALPSEESQPTDIGSIPVHLDEEGNVDLSKAPSFKDLPPADQDPKTRVTGGFTAVDTTSGEIVDVSPSKFILGDNTEFGNLAQRRFNYRDMPFFSVEHAFQTWKNGEFNEKIYKHPLWLKPGSKVQEKYYPNVNEKLVSVGKLPDGTQVTLPGNVNLMYDLIFDSMRQNPEVLKKFLESSGKFPAVEVPEGSFWEKAYPAILEGVWKHLRAVQPVITINVTGSDTWVTPKHKETMRKALRAIKQDIEGNGYRMRVLSGVQVGADQMGLDIAKGLGLDIGVGASAEQNVMGSDFTIEFTTPDRKFSPRAQAVRDIAVKAGKKLYGNPDVSVESKFRRALRRAQKNPLSHTISPEKEVEIKAEIARRMPGSTRYLRRQR